MNILKYILSFTLLLAATAAWGNESLEGKANYITLTSQNGLTSDNVYDICMDKNGCLWFATSIGLSRYDGSTVKTWFKEDMNIRSNYINYVYYDSRDRLWIGSANGVAIYDINTEKFLTLEMLSGATIENKAAWFFEDSDGTMWISFKQHGIISVNPDTFKIRRYFQSMGEEDYFNRIWFEPENDLFLLGHIDKGLFYVDMEKETIEPFHPTGSKSATPFEGKTIKSLLKTDDKTFFITCTDATMYIMNPYDRTYEALDATLPHNLMKEFKRTSKNYEKFRRATRVSENLFAIILETGFIIYDLKSRTFVNDNRYTKDFEHKKIHCIIGDIDKGLVIGMVKNGVAIQQDGGFRFSTIYRDRSHRKINLKGSDVSGFAEANDTTLWVTTRLRGLYRYNLKNGRLLKYNNPAIPKELSGATTYNNQTWLVSPFGIYRLSPESGAVEAYREGCSANYSLIPAPADRLTAFTQDGLLEYDPVTDQFKKIPAFEELTILGAGCSENGTLIALTAEKGTIRWDGKKVAILNKTRLKREALPVNPDIIYEDGSARIWNATANGSCSTLHEDRTVYSLNTRSGLPSDIITNIIGDNDGNIFISSDRSLTMISPSGKMSSVTKADGLLNFGFSRNSAYRTRTGDVLIGSRDGFTLVSHHKSPATSSGKMLEIERITSNGVEIPYKSGRIKLQYNQNTFDIKITDIDPYHVKSGRSLYCLQGYDNTWTPAGEDNKISYISIKPGKYTFRSYDPNIEPVKIRVSSHPLCSIVAIILYAVLAIILMSLIVIYIRNNEVRKRKSETMQMELDLHREKIDFFTNIAHEIKTPLTLITTPLNHIKGNESIDEEAKYDIDVMDKHASYLSSLIKELLEFSKIEQRKYNIDCKAVDICRLTGNIAVNFSEQFPALDWRINIPDESLWAVADTSAAMKILNNLIFNATKYAETFIEIKIEKSSDSVIICMTNDGKVIPVEMRERIFETFMQYRGNNGNIGSREGFGIGLSVARSLANMMGGSLHMGESTAYNEFILNLPLSNVAEEGTVEDAPVEVQAPAEGETTVLIVEDHPELLDYLKKTLSQNYRVLCAANGEEAMEIVRSRSYIDLVISDYKMPGMNGIDLCSCIKDDPSFSHILFVILSANLTPETKIECMNVGADAIVEKPFSMEFLVSRIGNLIHARKKLIEQITASSHDSLPETTEATTGFSAREMLLLRELNETIMNNFTDPNFGVDELAEALGISRSSLNRKIRDILHTTANNYIREKRIEKAEELLRTSSLQINEICYKVGFQTPSYFIKCFRKKYGKSPNEYANSPK